MPNDLVHRPASSRAKRRCLQVRGNQRLGGMPLSLLHADGGCTATQANKRRRQNRRRHPVFVPRARIRGHPGRAAALDKKRTPISASLVWSLGDLGRWGDGPRRQHGVCGRPPSIESAMHLRRERYVRNSYPVRRQPPDRHRAECSDIRRRARDPSIGAGTQHRIPLTAQRNR
jgi:hypothetical protein